MKPLHLEMKAFGPYPGNQEVDFRPLDKAGLFLIYGPTGAGKTTLLDAMAFALYGRTSSERAGEQMRCQYADEGTETEVTFEFSVGGDIYKAWRKPRQTRLKKKGEGLTEAVAEAGLWNVTAGELIAGSASDMEEEVKKLIGFEVDQFKQVILLPQGKFDELLSAKSERREELLQIIFGTVVYERIQDRLRERCGELKSRREGVLQKQGGVLSQYDVKDAGALEGFMRELRTGISGLQEEIKDLKKSHEAADLAFRQAEKEDLLFRGLEEARSELAGIESRKPDIEKAGLRHERADKASRLEDKVRQFTAQDQIRVRRQADVEAAGKELEKVEGELGKAMAGLACAKEKAKELPALRTNEAQLKNIRPKVLGLEETKGSLAQAAEGVKAAKAAFGESTRKVKALRKEIEDGRVRLEKARASAARLEAVNQRLRESERTHKDFKKQSETDASLKEARRVLLQAQAEKKSLAERHRLLKAKAEKTEELWLQSSAFNLAKSLKSGEACPVCGSPEHPHPADKMPKGLVVTDEELAALRESLKEATEGLSVADDKEREARARIERLDEKLRELDELIPKGIIPAVLAREIDRLKEEERICGQAAIEIKQLEATEKKAKEALISEEEALEAADKALRAVDKKEAGLREKLSERMADIGPGQDNIKSLDSSIEKLQTKIDSLERLQETAQKARQDVETKRAQVEERLKKARESRSEAESLFAEASKRLASALKAEGFANIEDVERALIKRVDLDLLAQKIRSFENEEAAAKKRVEAAMAKTNDIKLPNLPKIKREREEASQNLSNKRELLAGEKARLEGMTEAWKLLGELAEELEELDAEYARVARLSEAANGKNNLKISFQRYVLAALFDDVLRAANERLRMMSEGRYELLRSVDIRDRRFQGGLELDVADSYSGEKRSVKTLSGGETFLASLALALGLADVVQAQSGGVKLDSMFIDEGFGSLDADSLDHAIQTIVSLRQPGRLVGVISHVEGLKERFGATIEVRKNARGSTAIVSAT